MRIGISTACCYPMETEQALRMVVEGGTQCTELFLNADCEMSTQAVWEYRQILAGSGTKVSSLHPYTSSIETMLFFGDYPRRFADGLEYYNRFFQIAAELGAGVVVLHGAFSRHATDYERYLNSYSRLHERAITFGVRIAQENVGRCVSRDPELFRELRRQIPDAAFVLDIKQTLRGIGTLDDVMDAMGPNIAHLHFSDGREGADCLPVGEGTVDFVHLAQRLTEIAYQGDGVLELYRQNYSHQRQLWESVAQMKRYCKALLSE